MCIYICMYLRMYVHTYIYMYIMYIHGRVCAIARHHMYISNYIYIHLIIYIYICMYLRMYVYTYTDGRACAIARHHVWVYLLPTTSLSNVLCAASFRYIMRDKTHAYICETWLIHVRNMTHSREWHATGWVERASNWRWKLTCLDKCTA